MSILIKNMELPKEGHIIVRIYADGKVCEPTECAGVWSGVATAVPVPAHGDLIDASTKVTVQIYDDMYEEFHDEECTIADVLDRWSNEGCPEAIIPASGGKEDE